MATARQAHVVVTSPWPRSFWLEEALAREPATPEPLVRDTRCDVCIVGGGYTGLWTALRLKEAEPALDVLLIERDLCGSGASGRNGGFLSTWWSKFLSLEKLAGSAEALRLARAAQASFHEVQAFCAAEGIACDIRADGWLWTATNAQQVGAWQDTMDALARQGEAPLKPWTPDEVAARSGSPVHRAGVFERHAATLQPALLGRGLRRVALARGVRIHELTPLEKLVPGAPATLRTPRASIRAERVVLAMNAWAARWAEIRQAIVVVSGDIVMTPPMSAELASLGWRDGLGLSDGRALVHYYRTTPDGRIAFGKGGMSGEFCWGGRIGAEVEGRSSIEPVLLAGLQRTFPALGTVTAACSWRGPVDRSDSGLPFFWRLDGAPNVCYGVGFSGNGVGPCHLAGRILASLALEREDEWSGAALVRPPRRDFPPEPLRFIGSHLLRRALLAADDAADGERPAPLGARLLARFAPAGVSPFKVEA